MTPKFDPDEINVMFLKYTGGYTGGEVCATSTLVPKLVHWGLSPKKVDDYITKATGDWEGLRITVKLTIQNRQAQTEVVSASTLIISGLKALPQDRKKQKNVKHSRNISFHEIISNALQMRHQFLARNLSATIEEIRVTS
ncbi:60S ribosomal protein L12-like [Sarcophilus harrisii]|uniref:60S ribosomal protein L12-like n=1 Tax=Sarcophilus harrisii TaxID=9305 RepID=UPI001301F847|nr:60S ribosomal protein L12-like [Sarcophilus harrisii]